MNLRIADKKDKMKVREYIAFQIKNHFDVKVKPSRVHLRQIIETDRVILEGRAGGYRMLINFGWEDDEDE